MALLSQYQVAIINEDVPNVTTFEASSNTSSELNCRGTPPIALVLPDNFTNSNITFLVRNRPSDDYFPLTNFDGSAFSIGGTAGSRVPLQAQQFCSVIYLKLQTSVAQAEDCTVQVIVEKY